MLESKITGNKTIILIGSTGSGKSTLANVISGTNKFVENSTSTSVTREVQKEEFIESGINYIAIDTVGIGDTKLSSNEVLDKIAEAVYLARDGISQIFFLIDGRFDQKEIANYNLLKSIIFDDSVVSHTTVIRTNFPNFEKVNDCEEDKKSLLSQTDQSDPIKKLSEIISFCNGIIHVDNPSLNLVPAKNESEDRKRKREEKIADRKTARRKSREILLNHLQQICQGQKSPYKPAKLEKLSEEIFTYMEEKIKKREELEEKESKKMAEGRKAKEVEKEHGQKSILKSDKDETENNSVKDSKDEENIVQQENDIEQLEQDLKIDKKFLTKLNISALEKQLQELNKTKELIEGIQRADEQIRQVVFKHIFNNIDDIKQVTGSDVFLNSIANDGDISGSKLNFAELLAKRKELEAKLLEKKDDKSLKDIKDEIEDKEQKLLNLKKELLNDEKILAKWQEQGFNLPQAQQWADVLKNSFDPESDVDFCVWLRDDKRLFSSSLPTNLESLRSEYQDWLKAYNQELLKANSSSKSGPQITVSNILIIGITGNGKSALANLLAKTDEFKVSSLSTSITKEFQTAEFKWEKKNSEQIEYRVIDNIGFGDTNKISEEEILLKVGEGIYSAKEGLNQVLFVFGSRFGPEQIAAFNTFKKFIAESGITKYTTLIRTNFPDFKEKEKCDKDRQDLFKEENKDLKEIINSCNSIIYVDNPSIPEIDEDDKDSDDEREEEKIKQSKEDSREIVLNHLSENCYQSLYKLKEWDSIYAKVFKYIEDKKRIEQSNSSNKEEKLERVKNEVIKNIKEGLSAELSAFKKLIFAVEHNIQK
jgi:predicted GTPase